jgi:SAM-dependent methyltransferase
VTTARYDGHADWYDAWATTGGAAALAAARSVLLDLLPVGAGTAVDVGCGTGLHADALRDRGLAVVGADVSADQLRLAAGRLPVVRADAAALPVRSASVPVVLSVLTHTDLPSFADLVAEAVRVLAPGGCFVYVGVHPCFVHPFAEFVEDGVAVHAGYRQEGWAGTTPFTGNAVRARVGVHHLPLEAFLAPFLRADARLERLVEGGGGAVPALIGVRLRRCG